MSIDRGTLDRIVEALPQTDIWTGWLAMLIFVPLAHHVEQRGATLAAHGLEDAAAPGLSGGGAGADPLGGAAQLGQLAPGRWCISAR